MSESKLQTILDNTININYKIEKLEQKINMIQKDLFELRTLLNIVEEGTQNMNEHVEFVESVYDVVKSPFKYILGYYYRNVSNDKNNIENIDQIIDRKRIKQ